MISQNPGRERIDRHIAVRNSGQRGFTLVELMALLAMLALLAATVPLGMARSRTNGREVICVSNVQRLMGAAQMYAEDNGGRLPGNYHGVEPSRGSSGWARGWMDWSSAPSNTNIAYIADERYANLAGYLQRNPRVFKCPSDIYLSTYQRALGWTQRVRTYSANIGVGEGNAETGPFGTIYKHIRKTSEFVFPGPAENWVYTEEHPDSINDPAIFAPQATTWVDLPGVFHEGGAAFAFADGHAVMHRWIGSLTRLRTVTGTYSPPPTANKDPDIHWMSYGAGRLSTYSY